MATSTTYLSLRKPATTDVVNVTTDLNENYDKIDKFGLEHNTTGTHKLPNYTTSSGSFSGFTAAESKTANLTGLVSNNPVIRRVRVYISNDPGADTNINCRLSFYTKDTMLEQDLINDFYFNVTYTEIKTANWAASSTGGDVDSTAGLVKYDLIRLIGGTAEDVRISAVTDSDTLAVTTVATEHAVDEGVVKVAEINHMFQLYDADSSNEIHAKLEFLSAPNASTNVVIDCYVQ